MQEISFTVDPAKEQVFMTTINSKAGVSAVLIDTTLTVTIYDEELHPAIYDNATGEVAPLAEEDAEPIIYDGGSGSRLDSGVGLRIAASEFDQLRDLVPLLDPGATEIL